MVTRVRSAAAGLGTPVRGQDRPPAPTLPPAGHALHLALSPEVTVVERADGVVQFGLEPPRCLLVHDLSGEAAAILARLDGGTSTEEVVNRLVQVGGGRPEDWARLLADLHRAGLLMPMDDRPDGIERAVDPVVFPEWPELAGRHGARRAHTALIRRREALVQVHGAGRVATSLLGVLAGAGVGHVHLIADRPLRPSDVCPAGVATADGLGDRLRVTDVARRIHPGTATHPPGAADPEPGLVVLAGDRPVTTSQIAHLHLEGLVHLPVQLRAGIGVVGPLVLPGRSACLNCLDLHRTDRDPDWPRLAALAHPPGTTPAVGTATRLAVLVADQALDLIDGLAVPATVDATLEITGGDWRVRRRSWAPHPGCGCGAHRLRTITPGSADPE